MKFTRMIAATLAASLLGVGLLSASPAQASADTSWGYISINN